MKAALGRIGKSVGEPNLPSNIASACRQKQAFLFVRGDDGFVLKPLAEDGVIGVLVWVGWGDGGAPERHLPEVKRLARLNGSLVESASTTGSRSTGGSYDMKVSIQPAILIPANTNATITFGTRLSGGGVTGGPERFTSNRCAWLLALK